jgi:hypothetical protein
MGEKEGEGRKLLLSTINGESIESCIGEADGGSETQAVMSQHARSAPSKGMDI